MSTRYHVAVEFTADGRTHRDSYSLTSTSRAAVNTEVADLLKASPERFYDRTVRLYADETRLVAEWVEKAVPQ